MHVLRYVPSASPLHRSWAGTKICAIVVLTVGLLLWPTWAAGLIGLGVVALAVLVARLPLGVVPRIPRVVIWFVVVGVVLALAAGGGKRVHVGPVHVGLGGLDVWARLSLIGLDLLLFAAVMTWTTPLADLAPALARLGSPLRRLRLPLDEVVGAIALAIRCLPLLLEEVRMLSAARRTRRPEPATSWHERSRRTEELLMTALQSALRRAGELAEAIEARGGSPSAIAEPRRFQSVDLVCALVVVAAIASMGLVR